MRLEQYSRGASPTSYLYESLSPKCAHLYNSAVFGLTHVNQNQKYFIDPRKENGHVVEIHINIEKYVCGFIYI